MSELYRDYIDGKADEIINSLGGTITPAPANAELYRDFLDRKFDDVINSIDNILPIGSSSGNPATFYTSVSKPLVACTTEFMCTQEGSGDPSPSNVRPIHGLSEVNVTANNVVYTIQFGQEVYGAEVDVVNGVAHVTHNLVDLGDLNYAYGVATNWAYFAADIPQLKPAQPLKSDIFKFKGYSVLALNENYTISASGSLNRFYIRYDEYTDPADFKTAVTGHYLLFELVTPFDIQLTPTQIETLIGNNSFASDTENIDIKYRCLPIDLI